MCHQSDNLSVTPGPTMVEGERQPLQAVLRPAHADTLTPTPKMNQQINVKI